jgi:hypothetical protein
VNLRRDRGDALPWQMSQISTSGVAGNGAGEGTGGLWRFRIAAMSAAGKEAIAGCRRRPVTGSIAKLGTGGLWRFRIAAMSAAGKEAIAGCRRRPVTGSIAKLGCRECEGERERRRERRMIRLWAP